ncbi:MAG: CorA family divalent cation transporter [Cyclobacteriaceae bacterium]
MITKLKEKKEDDFEWIDITSPEKTELNEVATSYLLHRSLVEDSLQPEHLPKFEIIGDTHFIILRLYSHKAPKEADTIQEVTDKIAIFFGKDYLITIHRRDYEFLHEIRRKFVDAGKCTTPPQLLFRIMQAAISTYTAPIAALATELDYFEPKVFLQEKTDALLKGLYYVKRKASVIDLIMELTRAVVENAKGKISSNHFNQLKDDLLRHHTSARTVIENVANLLNIYISLSSQRTNEVVRVLTIFSVFFMPLTFIAGIYGMNFDFMPELRMTYGYAYVLGAMVVMTIVIYFWFKRKRWL